MQIEELIKDKYVLMIPVYSTRSYDSGTYNLLADGNISKFLMKILNSKAKEIDIFYPRDSINIRHIEEITNKYANCKVNWISREYGKNAHETRNMGQTFYNYIMGANKQYDYIISEIDSLAEIAITSYNTLCDHNNFIYWAGSWNANGTRWDDESQCGQNRKIAEQITTACLLKGQVDLYKGKSFYDECIYKPKYFDKKIIYFPFRLSDKSYHAEEFRNAIEELKKEGFDNFKVLYSDVNDSHIFDKEQINGFIKVPSDKFVYQAILKGMPIIPYLDDITKNYHSNIYEFIYYGCDVIMLDNDVFDNVTKIENVKDLKNTLRKKLGGTYE